MLIGKIKVTQDLATGLFTVEHPSGVQQLMTLAEIEALRDEKLAHAAQVQTSTAAEVAQWTNLVTAVMAEAGAGPAGN